VIVTSNLGFADWTQIFGEANLTAALLDRMTFRAAIINCSWESYRLCETLEQRVVKPNKRKQSGSRTELKGNQQED
jgi:DNA replication protein DnaC